MCVLVWKGVQRLAELPDRFLRVRIDQRDEALGETGEVPLHDAWLVSVRVPAAGVDGAENGGRVVGLHERARPVIDRLAGDRGVVRVHDAVDEPDEHPARHEVGLAARHGGEQLQVRVVRIRGVRVMPGDRVIGESTKNRAVVAVVTRRQRARELERPHPLVTCGHSREYRAGQRLLPIHGVAGRGDRERPRGGDSQGVHGLTDHVLAQHRPHRCQSVPTTRERGAARPLEVQVPPVAELAHEQRAAVAESGRVPAELVTCVGLRGRCRALRHVVAHQQPDPLMPPQVVGLQAQLDGQRLVEQQQLRRGGLGGLPGNHQLGQRGDVVGAERRPGKGLGTLGGTHGPDDTGPARRPRRARPTHRGGGRAGPADPY